MTLDSGTTTALNIGTGANAKTITIGNVTGATAVNINSGSGGINLSANNSSTGTVQIGTGGSGTNTPDILALDVKNNTGNPAGFEGAMYYNKADGKFRCYQGAAWTDCIGAGGGTPGGSNTQIQFNDSSAFGGDADFVWDKTANALTLGGTDTGIVIRGITNEPASPSAGNLEIYSKAIAGRMMLKWKAPSGVDTSLQPNLGLNTIQLWTPSLTSTGTGFGTVWPAGTGTFLNVVPTAGMGTQLRRARFTNVATTQNQILGVTASTAAQIPSFWRGNAAGQGGFFFQVRFTTELVPATTIRLFVGLTSLTTGVVAADTTTGDCAGLSHITTDNITTMAFMTRDNTTTTRATFTVPTLTSGNAYDFTMYAPPNGSTIYYRLVDLLTGNVIVDSSTTTTLPRNTIFMGPQVQMSNGTANTVVTTTAIGINKIYIESDN